MTIADWFIIGCLLVIIVVDVIFVAREEKTISNRMRRVGREVAALPFAWGVLGGHFYGPTNEPMLGSWVVSIGCLLLVTVFVGMLHMFLRNNSDLPAWSVLMYVPLGIPAGALFWPQ